MHERAGAIRRRVLKMWSGIFAASLLAGLASVGQAAAPSDSMQTTTSVPLSAEILETFHATMSRIPVPKEGCFIASYPSTAWRAVPCSTAPPRSLLSTARAASAAGHANVGNGNDYVAQVTSGVISSAIGSFKSVTGLTSESDGGNNNSFSLQLNTGVFTTSACSGAVDPSSCLGWQQFLYESPASDLNPATGFMQYWLVHYGTTDKKVAWECPTTAWSKHNDDCYINSGNSAALPNVTIANLGQLRLTAEAGSSTDTVIVTTPDGTAHAANGDSMLELAKDKGWQLAEFNVFGNDDGSQANFNGGVTIVVQTSVNNGTKNAPECINNGQTGETTNLSLASCTASGGSAPAIEFTESTPPTSIWNYTGPACSGNRCPGWQKIDDNGDTVRIAAGNVGSFYQLHNTGKVWEWLGLPCNDGSCPWILIDDEPNALQIAAAGTDLYQLLNTGVVLKYTGGGWEQVDSNNLIVTIVAAGSNLYELRNNGNVWGNDGSGWRELDSGTLTVALAAEGNNLYELHDNGEIWGREDTPCKGSGCPVWQKLDDNSTALRIIAASSGVYELHSNGEIYHYTGVPCSGSSCRGWQKLDDNPAAVDIAASNGSLWELHNTGKVWQYTGTPCTGNSCPGWQLLDDNSLTGRIEAGGGQLYEMHVPLVQYSRTLTCFECR